MLFSRSYPFLLIRNKNNSNDQLLTQVSTAYYLNFCTFFSSCKREKTLDIWCFRDCRTKNWAEQMKKDKFHIFNLMCWKNYSSNAGSLRRSNGFTHILLSKIESQVFLSLSSDSQEKWPCCPWSIFNLWARVEHGEVTNNSKAGLSPKNRKGRKNIKCCNLWIVYDFEADFFS